MKICGTRAHQWFIKLDEECDAEAMAYEPHEGFPTFFLLIIGSHHLAVRRLVN